MITVVIGPPCSGKSIYVRQHRRPGEITVDFDDLAQALGSETHHGHTDDLRRVTIAARSAAIRAAIDAHHRGARVWVVDMAPPQSRLDQYEQAGAKVIKLTVAREELHARADRERPPSWHSLIDQYLDSDGQAIQPPWSTRRRSSDPQPAGRTAW